LYKSFSVSPTIEHSLSQENVSSVTDGFLSASQGLNFQEVISRFQDLIVWAVIHLTV